MPVMAGIRMTPAPAKLAIGKGILFAILSAEAIALFVVRLAGTLQFNNFAFFDTGSNLTVQYLISRGLRPTIDFVYHYGLLPLLFGRIWFHLFGLTPIACVAAMPLVDLLIVLGLARFAANIRLNLAGVLMILLTAPLTIPSSFLNLTHGIEPVFLINALASQAAGKRRSALALATATLFVKPSMAFFLGFVLLGFIIVECLRHSAVPLRAFTSQVYPAVLVGVAIGSILAGSFGMAAVVRSIIPSEGFAMYRVQGFGLFNTAGRSFLSPIGIPWSYYLVNTAGPWIFYTIILVVAAIIAMRMASSSHSEIPAADRTSELVVTCALLHLSFMFFFFGNELSWIYYFYIPVLGLAVAARLGLRWELLVTCLAFAIPLSKVNKLLLQRLAPPVQETSRPAQNITAASPAISALPVEPGFTYQLWHTTSPSPETAGLWASRTEREEWARVLKMVRGNRASILEYNGCADLLFPEFMPPVTLFLVRAGVNQADLSRKLSQVNNSLMLVMPQWQRGLLDDVPEIGALVRRDFISVFQGESFIVYARRKS
jgi:hypothetical protein